MLVLVAYPLEAKPLIKEFALQQVDQVHYKSQFFDLLITGEGKTKVQNAINFLEKGRQSFCNIGVCGAKDRAKGSGFLIHQINCEESRHYPFIPPLSLPSETLTTLSQSSFDYTIPGLIDMEGAHFFTACSKKTTLEHLQLYKIVSDTPEHSFSPKEVPSLIESHLPQIEILLRWLKSIETEFSSPYLYQKALNRFHFSQTEKNFLYLELERWETAKKPIALENFKTGKELLHFLNQPLSCL